MSEENELPFDIHYFMTAYGYYMEDEDDNALSNYIDEKLAEGSKGAKSIGKMVFEFTKHTSELYQNCKDSYYWTPHSFLKNDQENWFGYKITNYDENMTLNIISRSPPGSAASIEDGKQTAYFDFELVHHHHKLRYKFGIGFYTHDTTRLSDLRFRQMFLELLKLMFIEVAGNHPTSLPNLIKDQEELRKIQRKFLKRSIGLPELPGVPKLPEIPAPLTDAINLFLAPSTDEAINFAEDLVVDLVPGVVGKVVVYIVFQILNALFTDYHYNKYVIINRSGTSFRTTLPYSKHVPNAKIPNVIKHPDDNLLIRTLDAPVGFGYKPLINILNFVLPSDSDAPPQVLLELEDKGHTAHGFQIDGFFSAYQINTHHKYTNRQGIRINDYVPGTAKEFFDELVEAGGATRAVETSAETQRPGERICTSTIKQHASTINGKEDPHCYIVIVIDQAPNPPLN